MLPPALPASHRLPIFNTGAIFFLHLSSTHSSPSLTGKVPPGYNSGSKPYLAAKRRERLTTPCCWKINMPISSEVKSNNSHYPERLSATFSLCVAGRAAFGILFHGSSFCFSGVDLGRRTKKSTGKGGQNGKKGRERSKSVTQTPVCESAFHNHERWRRHLPRHKKAVKTLPLWKVSSIFKQMSKGLSASCNRMLLTPPKKRFRTCLMFL